MKTVRILSMTLFLSVFCASMTIAQQQQQQQDRKAVQQKEQRVAQKKDQKGQQTKATAEERAAKQVDAMKQSLNLSNDQVTKLQSVQTQYIKDKDQARASKNGNQQDWKTKKDNYDSQVKSILTDQQYKQYQAQQSNMKKGQGKQGQGQANGKNGNWNKDKKDQHNQNNQNDQKK